MSNFRIVPQYHQYEAPESFVSRLAADNCVGSVDDLFRLLGIARYRGKQTKELRAREVLEMAGIKADDAWISVERNLDTATIGRHFVKREDVWRHRPRYCPHCVVEDIESTQGVIEVRPYQRFWWFWIALDRCVTHGCDIVAAEYDKLLKASDFARFIRSNLAKIREQASTIECRPVHPGDQYVWDRLVGNPTDVELLDGLPLQIANSFCEAVGEPLDTKGDGTFDKNRCDYRRSGFGAIANGRESFIKFLAARPYPSRSTGRFPKYGRLYHLLERNLHAPEWQPVIELVRNDALETLPLGAGDTVLGHVVTTRKTHSLWTAYQEYGFHPTTIFKLLSGHGLIEGQLKGWNYNSISFDALKAAPILEEVQRSVTSLEVITTLDITNVMVRVFRSPDLLQPIAAGDVFGDTRPRYIRDGYERILAELRAVPIDPAPIREYRPLLTSHRWSKVDAATAYRALREGKARAVRLDDKTSLSTLLVHYDDVMALRPIKNTGLPFRRARDFLKTTDTTLEVLVNNGVVRKIVGAHPVHGNPIACYDEDDLRSFRNKYIGLVELSKTSGLKRPEVNRLLREEGLEPIVEVSGTRKAWFFERDVVAKLLGCNLRLAIN